MAGTYSLVELKDLIRHLDREGLHILQDVLLQEEAYYTSREKKAVEKMIELRTTFLSSGLRHRYIPSA